MKIKDLLMRKDLPINVLIVVISLVLGLSFYQRHTQRQIKLKEDVDLETKKNALLEEIKPLPAKLTTIQENFWQADKERAVLDIITDELNKKLKEAEAEDIIVSSETTQDKDFFSLLPLKLTFKSVYKQMLNFIKFIDQNPKLLKIKQVSIMKISEEEETNGKLTVEILLDAYALKK